MQVSRTPSSRPPYSRGHLDVHQAELPGLAGDRLGELLGFVVFRGDRNDLLLGEAPGGVAQLLLLFSEGESEHAGPSTMTD